MKYCEICLHRKLVTSKLLRAWGLVSTLLFIFTQEGGEEGRKEEQEEKEEEGEEEEKGEEEEEEKGEEEEENEDPKVPPKFQIGRT
jgi:hypothetical protein